MTRMEARNVMLFLVVVGFFAVIAALVFVEIPKDNREYLQMLLMPLAGAFTGLLVHRQAPPEKKE